MAEEYRNVQADYCKRAADYLASAFTFEYSPEGISFWTLIHRRLYELGQRKRPTDSLLETLVGNGVKIRDQEIERLKKVLVDRNEEIDRQAQTIVALRRKLRLEGFMNMGR